MTKQECIISYNKQGYRTLEIPINPEYPKALRRNGWNTESTNLNIGEDNLYAVIQEETRLVIDIDDVELNDVLSDYLNKTLVVKTGNGGRHYYFEDISRLDEWKIKSTKLYKDGKIVGDIKAHMSYVVGCGSSYEEDRDVKTYTKVSSVDIVLKTDCFDILKILHENGITTNKTIHENQVSKKNKFENGLQVGERNNECFKTVCTLFEKEKLEFETGLNFIKTWNKMSEYPLSDEEVQSTVKSAWKRISGKEKFGGKEKIDNVATEIKKNHQFVTLRKSDEILMWNGKIYDKLQQKVSSKKKLRD